MGTQRTTLIFKNMKVFGLIACASASHSSSGSYSSSSSSSGSYSSSSSSSASYFYGECGGTITSDQSIFSPGFDRGYYYDYLDCTWDIQLGDDVKGFNIRAPTFNLEYQSYCGYDRVIVTGPDGEWGNFCGANGDSGRKRRNAEKEDPKFTLDLYNNQGFPDLFVPGNSARLQFVTDYSVQRAGFEFVIDSDLSRLDIIEAHATRIFDSLDSDAKYSSRYINRMRKTIAKMRRSDTGESCYEENGFGTEGDEVTVFDADNMCKLNGQVNAAINSWARNWACDGRGKVYRQIVRSARKVRNFYNDNLC